MIGLSKNIIFNLFFFRFFFGFFFFILTAFIHSAFKFFFSFSEKKKVNEQIELRKKIGMNPSVPPRPIKPFVPGVGRPLAFMTRSPPARISAPVAPAPKPSPLNQPKPAQQQLQTSQKSQQKPVNQNNSQQQQPVEPEKK